MFFIGYKAQKPENLLEAVINLKVARAQVLRAEDFDTSAQNQAGMDFISRKKTFKQYGKDRTSIYPNMDGPNCWMPH